MKLSTTALFSVALGASQSVAFSPAFRSKSGVSSSTELQMASPAAQSVFLSPETTKKCVDVANGTPLYAYSMDKLTENADACLAFPNAYGLTVRYAMKACPNGTILKLFNKKE